MKFTEGSFRDWGYALAKSEFGAVDLDGGPWQVIEKNGHKLIIKDAIADAFLQQILLRPDEYSVVATLNLNGDYISDSLGSNCWRNWNCPWWKCKLYHGPCDI